MKSETRSPIIKGAKQSGDLLMMSIIKVRRQVTVEMAAVATSPGSVERMGICVLLAVPKSSF